MTRFMFKNREELEDFNRFVDKMVSRGRPRVILSAAMSIDGRIATKTGESRLSSKEDTGRIHRLRSEVDAILVGKNTVDTDDPLLTVRHAKGNNPARIILCPLGDISTTSKIFRTAHSIPTMLVCTEKIPQEALQRLQKSRVKPVVMGMSVINLKRLLSMLYKQGIRSVLVEGGGRTNWEFVRRDLVDEIIITVTPFVIGGEESTPLVGGAGFEKISDLPRFALQKTERLGDELVLHYAKL